MSGVNRIVKLSTIIEECLVLIGARVGEGLV